LLEPLIDGEVRELVESPCSQIVATVDETGSPEATRGWAIDVLPGGRELRLLLSASATATLANLATTGWIALTVTHFATLESVQVKGHVVSVDVRTAADRIRFEQFCAACTNALHDLEGTPEETIWRLMPVDVVACVMTVEEVYDQTPGPAAGARLAPIDA
jgi:hypothetical protein